MAFEDEDLGVAKVLTDDEISEREQVWLRDAIQEGLDLSSRWADAVNSLRIVLAADESIRTKKVVQLG